MSGRAFSAGLRLSLWGIAAVAVLAACSGSGNAVVSSRAVDGVGTVLTDTAGKTLYATEQERGGKILCVGGCAKIWVPLTVTDGTPDSGGVPGKLATVKRPDDGKTQLTYDGKPVYTFAEDREPGQVKGHNLKDDFGGTAFSWTVVTVGGAAPSDGGTGESDGGSGGGGYGY